MIRRDKSICKRSSNETGPPRYHNFHRSGSWIPLFFTSVAFMITL